VRECKKTNPNKFNHSDWAVVIFLGALVLCGILFSLFKLVELEEQALNGQIENTVENDGEVRGSGVLDIFVSKKSALILVVGDCEEDSECPDYLATFFVELVNIKKSAPALLVFDIGAARERNDTNLNVVLEKLNAAQFPLLILIENGVEVTRKEGTQDADDELHYWLVDNGIIADEENTGD